MYFEQESPLAFWLTWQLSLRCVYASYTKITFFQQNLLYVNYVNVIYVKLPQPKFSSSVILSIATATFVI